MSCKAETEDNNLKHIHIHTHTHTHTHTGTTVNEIFDLKRDIILSINTGVLISP